jgi:hypothetical protein
MSLLGDGVKRLRETPLWGMTFDSQRRETLNSTRENL